MLLKLEAIVLIATSALCDSYAEVALVDQDEAKHLRGIEKHLKHANKTISKSNMRGENEKVLQGYAAALRQVEAHPAVLTEKNWKTQIQKFWKAASDKISAADEKNGYISGVLLLQPGQEFLEQYNKFGGVGLVYLSWAGLALGFKDNAEKMWTIANGNCGPDGVGKASVGLTINVLSQGIGLASILGAGPVGGAAFGLISAGIGYGGGKLMDLLPDDDCDDELKDYSPDVLTMVDAKKLDELKMCVVEGDDGKPEVYYPKDMHKWTFDKAEEIRGKISWSEIFEKKHNYGSSYGETGKNGLPTYSDPQSKFD